MSGPVLKEEGEATGSGTRHHRSLLAFMHARTHACTHAHTALGSLSLNTKINKAESGAGIESRSYGRAYILLYPGVAGVKTDSLTHSKQVLYC